MIRRLERSDYTAVIEMLMEFANETGIKDMDLGLYDPKHAYQVLLRCQHAGISLVATTSQGQIVGMLLSMKCQDVWLPTVVRLREIAWWVKPEHRGTSLGGRLFFNYCNLADQMLQQGEITGYTMTKLVSSEDYDYERRGMRLVEATYMKEA